MVSGRMGPVRLAVLPVLALLAVAPAQADTTHYTFQFQNQALGQPVPTGGFGYDSATGVFSNFVVMQSGVSYDYTAEANRIGGKRRLPFELGFLGQNLIDGYGPLGPELSRWYGGLDGFYGFEWRTPAADFLYYDLTIGAPSTPISSSPRAFGGTWTTTVVTAAPEPATWGMLATAAVGFAVLRRRRVHAANNH